jgi:flagellar protein FlaI
MPTIFSKFTLKRQKKNDPAQEKGQAPEQDQESKREKKVKSILQIQPSLRHVPYEEFKVELYPTLFSGALIDQYDIEKDVRILIVDEAGKGRYIIVEPPLNEQEQKIYGLLMKELYFSMEPPGEISDPISFIENYIWWAAEKLGIVDEVRSSYPKFRYYLKRDTVGYRSIDPCIRDSDVEEISCEGYSKPIGVIHKRYTKYDWLDTNITYPNEFQVRSLVQHLVQRAGKNVTTAIPYVDATMKEGHRLVVTFENEITQPGSSLEIRKFPIEPLSVGHLIKYGTFTSLLAAYYWLLIEHLGFVFVVGAMGSGKSTGLNALATMIPPNKKIISIEDTREIKLPHTHWLQHNTRMSYSMTDQKYDINLFSLVKLALRERPDYLLVGEIRGEEASTVFQAGQIGHGLVTSFHAHTPDIALVRLRTPPFNIDVGQLLSISSILMMRRLKKESTGDFVRKAVSSAEVIPDDTNPRQVKLNKVFDWDPKTDRFTPNSPIEVVRKSYRLQELVMNTTGWDGERTAFELDRRKLFLEKLVSENKITYTQIANAFQEFYMGKTEHVIV